MNDGIVIAVGGLLVFAGMVAAAVAWTVPIIEADLVHRATVALTDRKLTFASVEAEGLDLTVTGTAPDEARRREAIDAVLAISGGHAVRDEMVVLDGVTDPAGRRRLTTVSATVAAARALDASLDACQAAVDELLNQQQFEFQFGSARMRSRSDALLTQVRSTLSPCPEVEFEIGGHTDSVGTSTGNLQLSQRRAAAVLNALASVGFSRARMKAVGYGSTIPKADNKTAAGRARNRRIELRIIRKD